MSAYGFSVLIAVCARDDAEHFETALKSIYDQTLVASQVVLVADGPLPEEHNSIIHQYEETHEGFLCVRLEKNQGLAAALNTGLKYCDWELVARMDSDDVCETNRFIRQTKFMDLNPKISVASGKITEYSSDLREVITEKRVPLEHSAILAFSKYRNPINHMACIFRKSAVLAVGGYPEHFRKAQDFALWAMMLNAGYRFGNTEANLVNVRAGEGLFERRGLQYFYGEIIVFWFMRKIGHINTIQLLINLIVRLGARLSPVLVKRWVYKVLRRKGR